MAERAKVLVVDDVSVNVALVRAILVPLGFDCITAPDGEQGFAAAIAEDPDVILLDVMMPGQDGYETARRLRAEEITRHTPIIMVTATSDPEARAKALAAGADDFLTKPIDKDELHARVQSVARFSQYRRQLESQRTSLDEMVASRTVELQSALDSLKRVSLEVILRLARASEYKDSDTGMHIERMSRFAAAIARKMGLPDDEVENILYAAPMHDIGKIGIPDNILLKPDRLDNNEWEVMKQHTIIGACILEGSEAPLVDLGRIIALTHHERWDGAGYPMGMSGEDIPLAGRITSVSDVFDALSSRRPYKDPISSEETFQMVRAGRGTQFDPIVVDALYAIHDEIEEIRRRYQGV